MTDIQLTSTISVELIRAMAEDRFVAEAARVSTKGAAATETRGHRGLINALMRDRHGSPFEHNSFTFRVHAPLFVMTEHLRHRAGWSYNGESGRYKTMDPVFYTPHSHRPVVQVGKAMDYDMQRGEEAQRDAVAAEIASGAAAAYERYELLLAHGIAREVARQVLPVNLMTTYYTTCNARSLMAFLALRTSDSGASKPLWEIEQVASQYEDHLMELMPITAEAFDNHGRVAP